jgi:hypothetical protein
MTLRDDIRDLIADSIMPMSQSGWWDDGVAPASDELCDAIITAVCESILGAAAATYLRQLAEPSGSETECYCAYFDNGFLSCPYARGQTCLGQPGRVPPYSRLNRKTDS